MSRPVPLSPARMPLPRFAGDLLAFAAGEVASKASRLLVVVSVARVLDPAQIGLAAAAIAVADLVKALAENGIGQRLIASPEAELDGRCATARRLFWAVAVALVALQCAIAAAIWAAGGEVLLAALIAVVALEYLFMPAGLVHCALSMRAGRMKRLAAIAGTQVVAANLISAGLALVWPSAAALVLPRLLVAPGWLWAQRRAGPWAGPGDARPAPVRPFLAFGAGVVGVSLVGAARMHGDKLVVGAAMGPEALGLWFLAWNAGTGLATALVAGFERVLFPVLASAAGRVGVARSALRSGLGLLVPAVLAQALAAPLYVPLLLGAERADLAPAVSVLCLGAVPLMLWSWRAGELRAGGRVLAELLGTAALAAAALGAAALAAPHGVTALAAAHAAATGLVALAAAAPALPALMPVSPVASVAKV